MTDDPIETAAGLSGRRERFWGLVGGTVGSAVGIGAFAIAWLVQGASAGEMSGAPYPSFLARRVMMPLDYYFLALILVGLAFLGSGLFATRFGRYPRSDGFGATLLGTILCALGGIVLFVRLWAVLHGSPAVSSSTG
jgi:hypothetical protein